MTNLRFLAIWGALVPVLTGAVLLVQPLGLATWTDIQTGLIVTAVNTFSAVVLATVAHFWQHSTSETAAVSGALSGFLLSIFALGNGFNWWQADQKLQDQLLSFFGVLLLFGLALFVRQNVSSKETVTIEKAKSAGPENNAK